MAKRKKTSSLKKRKSTTKGKRPASKARTDPFLLEKVRLSDLLASKKKVQQIIEYHWRYYSELAHQRKAIESEISHVLIQTSISDFPFNGWQRSVKYKYGLHPFCILGSLTDPGGRFNIGDINPQSIPTFPALYLAHDKDTALQETLGQVEVPGSSFTPQELSLTSPDSITIVSVRGQLDKVFDVRSAKNLKKFVDLVKDFKLSRQLIDMARKLGEPLPETVQQPKKLHDVLHASNWRDWPMKVDVPASSQIFGQLVYFAGIEGILYKSKLTGRDCLAIYPGNFEKSDSYIEMEDNPPSSEVPTRIDSSNWKISYLSFNEL